MRIRKLELHGFKSFPDRTVVEFGQGICCVVGPNGCGKSNIMDAIRWCIGEQSAKSLRGSEMLDVIFAGSEKRAPVGFAEVNIVFSADDGEPFPGEYARYSELSVGRRLHRTGASEYLINRERCRRKDIIDLFLDTGIGNNLYSFIEQGSIGKIVQATPQERRGMIEEAAGIAKYRTRRHEAQQKLESTATQLDRAADVEEELRSRLVVVEKQVHKAARYRRLRARVKQGEILLSLARYADLAADRTRLDESVRRGKAQSASCEARLERHEEQVDDKREDALLQEAVVASHRDDAAEQDAQHRELEGAQGFRERRRIELATELERVVGDVERARGVKEAALEEIKVATADVESLLASVAVAERDRTAREERLANKQEARRQAQERLRELERLAAAAEVRATEARARLVDLEKRLEGAQASRAENRAEREEAAATVTRLEERGVAARDAVRAAAEAAREATEQVERCGVEAEEANRLLREARQRVGAARSQVETLQRQAAAAAEANARTLTELDRRSRREDQQRRQQLDRELRDAERKGRDEVARVARTADQRIAEAERAHREHKRAAEQRRSSAIESTRSENKRREQALLQEWSQRLRAAESASEERRKTARAEADRQRTQAVESARAARQTAQETLRAREQGRGEAMRRVEALDGERLGLVERAKALRERIEAEHRRAVGARSVAERFDAHERLGDHEGAPDWAGRVLGRRLGLPMVRQIDEILSAREALDEGTASLWWWGERDTSWDAALGGTARCDSLAAALEHHQKTGGAAVCTVTGDRVDSDGVITLGTDDGGAAAAVALSQELARVEERLASVSDELETARAALEALEAELGELRGAVVAAEKELEGATERAGVAWQQAIDLARGQTEAELATLRSERETALDTLREALSEALAAATAAADAELESSRDAGRDAIDVAKRAREEQLDVARTEAQAVVTALRARLEAEAEAAREALEAQRKAHQEQVETERESTSAARETAEAELRTQREALAEHERTATSADRTRNHAESRRRDAELASVRASAEADRVEAELREVRTRINNLDLSLEGLERAVGRLTAERDEARSLVEDAESGATAPLEEVEAAQDRVSTLEAEEEELRNIVTVADIEIASLKERAEGRRGARQTAERRVREAQDDIERLAEQQLTVEETAAKNVAELEGARADLTAVAEARAIAWDRLQEERDRLESLRARLKELEDQGREMVEERDAIAKQLSADELRLHETIMELEALVKRIDERYLLSLPGLLDRMDAMGRVEIAPELDVQQPFEVAGRSMPGVPVFTIRPDTLQDFERIEATVEEVESLRRKLRNLGEVNLAALEEYDDVKQRHDELASQRDDLERAVAAIRASIAKMNRHCRDRFRETFERVNENFTVAYPRLVGGGSARLVLTDEEDMLATGVEVMVQPPGKRVQNLTLLSGGEKAMCALAMIMSLFQVKPSPFCLLDEVDAPLDEANGARFNEMLREMSEIAQFIVITHNRKTMEVGDTLYGITMGQPGVSRLVSVQMPA